MFYYNSMSPPSKKAQKMETGSIDSAADTLGLASVFLYILQMSFDTTLFQIPWPPRYLLCVRIMACSAILLKAGRAKSFPQKSWVLCALSFFAFKHAWLSTGYNFLLDTTLLVASTVGMPCRKLLKVGFWTELCVFLLAIQGSLAGCIPDLAYKKTDALFRHSFGIVYPTDCAAHVAFLALAGWVLYGGKKLVYPLFCVAGCIAFTYFYCGAKCSTIILLLLMCCITYFFITERLGDKFKAVSLMERIIDSVLTYALPICAVLMVGLTYLYDADHVGWNFMNNLLTDRLRLGHEALERYGIKLFGTAFPQVGYGGRVAWSYVIDYNFVDSSYVLILVRYGVAVLLAICIQYIWLERKARRNGHRKLMLALALVAVHSMIEHHLLELAYNLFLFLPFADFTETLQETDVLCKAAVRPNKKRIYAIYTVGCVGGIVTIMLSPKIITNMKTAVDVLKLDSSENHLWFISLAAACLLLTGAAIWLLSKLFSAFVQKKMPPRNVWLSLGILTLVIFGVSIWGELAVRHWQTEYQELVSADKPIIEELLNISESADSVYIDHLPAIYQREFGGMRNTLLPGECLAAYENTTLITEDKNELLFLMEADYSYGSLASGHAVYTNSEAAREALERNSVFMTDYYSRQETLNLKEVARNNGLAVTKNDTFLLHGSGDSIWYGPNVTVYHGMLRVEYTLRLINCPDSENAVMVMAISSDLGAKVWAQEDIPLRNSDVPEIYTIDAYMMANCPNVEFWLTVPDGVQVEVLEIKYGKVG